MPNYARERDGRPVFLQKEFGPWPELADPDRWRIELDPACGHASAIMYESKAEQLLPFRRFVGRMGRSLALAAGIGCVALGVGTVGYHLFASLSWIDSFLNASMILGGMGPVDKLETAPAKLFASFYALFSGIVFIALMGVVLAPAFHRMIHRFHIEDEAAKKRGKQA